MRTKFEREAQVASCDQSLCGSLLGFRAWPRPSSGGWLRCFFRAAIDAVFGLDQAR
jgi:hypothetical protein